jgi:threonine dehydrogenase-like Zn-dependent dehydrogenase
VSDAAALGVADTFTSGSTGPEAAAVPPGGIVAVFGQGHIGLAAAAFARATGAGLVVTVKARPGGEDLSAAMGADRMFNVQQHDVQTEILKLTNGVGVDCAIEASGQQSSFPTAVSVTRPGGSIVVLSTYHSARGVDLPIPLAEWGWGIGDKTILSTFQQAGSERVSRLLRLAENGRIDPSPLFTRTYKFAEIEQAFADVANRSRGLIKPLVTF